MSLRRWAWLAILVLAAAVAWAAETRAAGGLVGWLKKPYVGPAPNTALDPGRHQAVPPGHQRFYAYNVEDYPWFKNGYAVPTYNWGYFGARYRAGVVGQHPYYPEEYSGGSFRSGD
jgi:hypothetical protein